MDSVEKQALKDLAHLFVDKELGPLLKDLIAKLPSTYAPIAAVVESAVEPAVIAALDAQIDKF